jgi:glutathione S-transferase
MSIVIYGSIGSRASRCLWTAEETGAAYEWISITTLDGSNRKPDYLAINPSGKIPAMTDGDVVLTESMAINQYIALNYGQGGVWPNDRASQARVLQWTFWSATEIEYYIGAIFPHLVMKSAADRDQALVERLLGEMMPKFVELENALAGKDYVLGAFTLADINLSVQTFSIVDRFGLDLAQYPNVRAWTERCRDRPARRKIDALAVAAK